MRFKMNGVVPPMITPFDENGNLDEENLIRLVEFLSPRVDGLFICGSYGSGPLMTLDERKRVAEIVKKTASPQTAGKCVEFILAKFGNEPRLPAAGAVPFLKLMGILLGGWQMGRAALIAQAKLAEDGADAEFLSAKLVTARFYGEHLLPQIAGLAPAILQGAESVMALDEALF